jgi:Ca2+-binding EF-hand superfamily protein
MVIFLKNFHKSKKFLAIIFHHLKDQNKPKSIREKENRELKAAFQIIDKDKNGYIDKRELKALFDSLKVDITKDQIKGIVI